MKKKYDPTQFDATEFDSAIDGKTEPECSEYGEWEQSKQDEDTLSYAEMKMLRTTLKQMGNDRTELGPHDTSDRAHAARWAKRNKLMTSAILVIAVAILAAIGFGIYALVSYLNSRPNTSAFSLVLGQEDPYEIKYSDAVREGVLYVEMKQIAQMTDAMIVSGTKTNRKFTADDGTSLRFENDSEIAEVNGERVKMWVTPFRGGDEVLARAIVTQNECWIPYEFLASVVEEGLLLRLDAKHNTITIRHIHYVTDGDKENAEPSKILFSVGDRAVLPALTEPPEYEWFYGIDIAPYLEAITEENLLLANKRHPLGESFLPKLTALPPDFCWGSEEHQLQNSAAIALSAMMKEMRQAGVEDVYVTSSYRSYAQQTYLFDKYVADHMAQGMTPEQAEAEAATYSAKPGQSEHQTGLCVDFSTNSINGALTNEFEQTAASAWLLENAYKFGFILRYPEEKVDLTEYSYESWHYRFVGREAATEIFFESMCLEEYLGVVPAGE